MNIKLEIKVLGNYVDAHDRYGLRLSKGALEALMTPPPAKERITNKSRLQHGTRVVASAERVDERTISLPVHFCAPSETTFLARYEAFCALLSGGVFDFRVTLPSGKKVEYKTYYQSCAQYSQYYGGIAKFVLKLHEPNPTDR